MDIFDVESFDDTIFDNKEEDQGIQNKVDEGLQKRLKRDEDEYFKAGGRFKQFDVIFNDDLFVHGDEVNANDSEPGEGDIRRKKIMEDWRILKEGLPNTIFVRAYKGCKDFLRAVIVGEPGTPFHDGLFFFDIMFPASYPNKPPDVTYRSHDLQLHPKLGSDGKVHLSLLKKKKWNTDLSKSNVLRVLMSIQERILNSKPYFDKPNKKMLPRWIYKNKSLAYNEETFKLSCETMLEVMHKPPKDFEFFVAQHFRDRSHTILRACLAYIDGEKVGGPIQDDASSVCSTIDDDHYDSSTVPDYDSSSSDVSSIGSTIISSPNSRRRRRKASAPKVVTSKSSLPSKAVTLKSKNSRGATDGLFARFYQVLPFKGVTSKSSLPSKAVTSKSKNFRGVTEDLYARFFQAFKMNGSTLDYFLASY
ncbi:hypothetical protein MKW98_013939 [Papaver atlanticum]|uniref:UBC core domain-containing protein n=1 Tax=Papaver atlanticum TaxID=357466 RepID=A0AAD4XG13_9MAGN|nr:hypothetical protein MKW98_013939 [Papaver atlanticum]